MKNLNMGSKYGIFLIVFVFMLITVNEAKEYKVGGALGWKEPGEKDNSFYKEWAAKEKFHVGDSLRFDYKHDSVLVVDKWAYYHCNTTKPIKTFRDGHSAFNLTKLGPIFFISGDENHCENGQRLAVDVVSLHPPPPKKSAAKQSVTVKIVAIYLALVATSVALA